MSVRVQAGEVFSTNQVLGRLDNGIELCADVFHAQHAGVLARAE